MKHNRKRMLVQVHCSTDCIPQWSLDCHSEPSLELLTQQMHSH